MIKPALLALLPFASPALAEGFSLALPIDCPLEQGGCYIQQYVDHDPGPGASDFHCRGLTDDGHKGTDFAVPTLADMAEGVAVIAAGEGVVAGTRDGMPDTGLTDATAAAIEGRECGNGVLVRHPDGYETQYCHLREGSVVVERGDRVQPGTVLGLIGQSGRAEFPHLHLSVRKDGAVVDPFDPDGQVSCDSPGDSTLWAETPNYQPGGLLDFGFAAGIPDYGAVKAGTAGAQSLPRDAPALVVFAFAFGTRAGDVFDLAITGPQGEVISQQVTVERAQAQAFRAIGRRLRGSGWPEGTYQGRAQLLRDGRVLSKMQGQVRVGG